MSGARGDRGGTGRGAATGVGGPDPPGATGGIGEFFLFFLCFFRGGFLPWAQRVRLRRSFALSFPGAGAALLGARSLSARSAAESPGEEVCLLPLR